MYKAISKRIISFILVFTVFTSVVAFKPVKTHAVATEIGIVAIGLAAILSSAGVYYYSQEYLEDHTSGFMDFVFKEFDEFNESITQKDFLIFLNCLGFSYNIVDSLNVVNSNNLFYSKKTLSGKILCIFSPSSILSPEIDVPFDVATELVNTLIKYFTLFDKWKTSTSYEVSETVKLSEDLDFSEYNYNLYDYKFTAEDYLCLSGSGDIACIIQYNNGEKCISYYKSMKSSTVINYALEGVEYSYSLNHSTINSKTYTDMKDKINRGYSSCDLRIGVNRINGVLYPEIDVGTFHNLVFDPEFKNPVGVKSIYCLGRLFLCEDLLAGAGEQYIISEDPELAEITNSAIVPGYDFTADTYKNALITDFPALTEDLSELIIDVPAVNDQTLIYDTPVVTGIKTALDTISALDVTPIFAEDLVTTDLVDTDGILTNNDTVDNLKVNGLLDKFPFCVPMDLYRLLNVLKAEPIAPAFRLRFYVPKVCDTYFDIDLKDFDGLASLTRKLMLLLFCVGLAYSTRYLIKG